MDGNPVRLDDDVVQLMSRLEGGTDLGHPELQTLTAAALTGQGDVVFIVLDCNLVQEIQVSDPDHLAKESQDAGPIALQRHQRHPGHKCRGGPRNLPTV
jgi:hypothetical protein